jgi:hypothetical protein
MRLFLSAKSTAPVYSQCGETQQRRPAQREWSGERDWVIRVSQLAGGGVLVQPVNEFSGVWPIRAVEASSTTRWLMA